MKNIAFCLALLLFVSNVFSQAPTSSKKSKDQYLIKSKNQKKVANILLVGGAACILTAFLIPKGELVSQGFIWSTYKNDDIKSVFGGVGGLSMLASIPFYIISSKNKRRANAATISFHNQRIIFPQRNVFLSKTQPALTLKIKL